MQASYDELVKGGSELEDRMAALNEGFMTLDDNMRQHSVFGSSAEKKSLEIRVKYLELCMRP